mmetsp:Transcript_36025/g.107760  ORF Transcript_36025/g.107760 Transcript_36025/m.107760 type:complete len:388 (-) Transcript_36025:725-1888(-)
MSVFQICANATLPCPFMPLSTTKEQGHSRPCNCRPLPPPRTCGPPRRCRRHFLLRPTLPLHLRPRTHRRHATSSAPLARFRSLLHSSIDSQSGPCRLTRGAASCCPRRCHSRSRASPDGGIDPSLRRALNVSYRRRCRRHRRMSSALDRSQWCRRPDSEDRRAAAAVCAGAASSPAFARAPPSSSSSCAYYAAPRSSFRIYAYYAAPRSSFRIYRGGPTRLSRPSLLCRRRRRAQDSARPTCLSAVGAPRTPPRIASAAATATSPARRRQSAADPHAGSGPHRSLALAPPPASPSQARFPPAAWDDSAPRGACCNWRRLDGPRRCRLAARRRRPGPARCSSRERRDFRLRLLLSFCSSIRTTCASRIMAYPQSYYRRMGWPRSPPPS